MQFFLAVYQTVTTLVPTSQSSCASPSCILRYIIIIIISAVHATAGRWPPQLTPCTSILSHPHPLTATNFLDVVSPSPFGSPFTRFPSLGVHSDVILAHLVLLILAACPAHCPPMHRTLSIIYFNLVLHLIVSFRILSHFVMSNNNLSMLRWATASFSRCGISHIPNMGCESLPCGF